MAEYCVHCGADADDFKPEAKTLISIRFADDESHAAHVRSGTPQRLVLCAMCGLDLIEFLEPLKVHEPDWTFARAMAAVAYDNHRKGKGR